MGWMIPIVRGIPENPNVAIKIANIKPYIAHAFATAIKAGHPE
jgi:hypothetical protein